MALGRTIEWMRGKEKLGYWWMYNSRVFTFFLQLCSDKYVGRRILEAAILSSMGRWRSGHHHGYLLGRVSHTFGTRRPRHCCEGSASAVARSADTGVYSKIVWLIPSDEILSSFLAHSSCMGNQCFRKWWKHLFSYNLLFIPLLWMYLTLWMMDWRSLKTKTGEWLAWVCRLSFWIQGASRVWDFLSSGIVLEVTWSARMLNSICYGSICMCNHFLMVWFNNNVLISVCRPCL